MFPHEVTDRDIQVMIETNKIIIRALGSGSSFNRLIQPTYGLSALRSISLGSNSLLIYRRLGMLDKSNENSQERHITIN